MKSELNRTSLVKVFFKLDDTDWHGYDTESVWAEKVSSNRCRLRNTPFYIKGVSFHDVVFVKKNNGNLIYESTSMLAGHSTYRIILDKHTSKKV